MALLSNDNQNNVNHYFSIDEMKVQEAEPAKFQSWCLQIYMPGKQPVITENDTFVDVQGVH